MNSSFNEWYIDVCLSPQEGQIERRIASVEEYAEDISVDEIVDLVKLYYGLPVEDEAKNKVVSKFSKNDSSFSARYLEELALLSGAVLVEIAENNSNYDSLAEQLSLTTKFCREPASSEAIIKAIQEQFDEDRIALRESDLPKANLTTNTAVSKFKDHIEKNKWDSAAPSELMTVLNKFQNDIASLQKSLTSLKETQSVYREDSQLLWWMTSEWSNTLGCRVKTIDKAEGCLMVGYEAASFIANDPGPYAIEGVLNKMIGACKGKNEKIPFPELIMKTNQSFKEKIVQEMKQSPLLGHLPLCNAIICSNNTEKIEEWYPKFKRDYVTLKTDICLLPCEYAWQMYLECLAQRCYTKLLDN